MFVTCCFYFETKLTKMHRLMSFSCHRTLETKKCVDVHYTFCFCLFEKNKVKFLVLCSKRHFSKVPYPVFYQLKNKAYFLYL